MEAINIARGILILEAKRPREETPYHVSVEHDEIYAGSLKWPLAEEDTELLIALGWEPDEDLDRWVALT